ncbi:MAG TPA: MlaD family protein [Thermoanaerobaculia bacterium]|nr:MlaD family protein [Thermoanaerobaculia bacterium]
MKADARTRSRVGIIVFAAILLFAGAILTVGGKRGFFIARSNYFAHFPNSQGVVAGNQVRLTGVVVGAVHDIEVPKKPGQDLTIYFDIERRYQHLIKADSQVEIRTIGLLGDKYLELSPGSPDKPDLPPDSEIKAIRSAELDKILASGGDLVENVLAISKSLRNILGRTEQGEGFLGELTSESEQGKALGKSLRETVDSANLVLKEIREGKGLVGRLLRDEGLANEVDRELRSAVASVNRIALAVEKGTTSGEGIVPALLSDPEGKKKFYAMVDSVKATADALAAFSKDLSSGQGAIPRLVRDEAFSKEFLADLKRLSAHLANVAAKLDSTDGTAGRLIADPAVYDAINDFLVGVNESKFLRWLVRDRQKSGIEKRYYETKALEEAKPPLPAPTPPPTGPASVPTPSG